MTIIYLLETPAVELGDALLVVELEEILERPPRELHPIELVLEHPNPDPSVEKFLAMITILMKQLI